MRKLFILLLLLPLFSFGQQIDSIVTDGHFEIKNVEFTFEKIDKGFYYDDKGLLDSSQSESQFVLFRNNKQLLTHTLRLLDGDCNSNTVELGDVEVTDSSIIFYSYYAWIGGCCGLPYGARIQMYKINNKGYLYLDKSEIYLERYKEKVSEMDGARQKQWILETEKDYNAKFVLGKKADQLMKKVKLRLAKRISKETEDWPTSPYGIKYGYRR
jgi:hypothetical protein